MGTKGGGRPALQCYLAQRAEPIYAALGALEPAVDVAQQNATGPGRDHTKVPRPSGPACSNAAHAKACCRYAVMIGWRVEPPDDGSPLRRACSLSRRLRRRDLASAGTGRLGEDLDAIARDVHRHQPEAERAAEAVDTRVPVASAPGRRHGQPHLIGDTHAIHRLQQQIEAEAELQFDNREPQVLLVWTATMSQPWTSPFTRKPAASRKRFTGG